MDRWETAVQALWEQLRASQTLPTVHMAALDRAWVRLWPGRTPEEQRILAQLGEALAALNTVRARREGR